MKFEKLLGVILCFALVFSMTACNNTDSNKTIAVVAKGESHAFWQSVKKGATDAAKEHGYTITFRGPASESAKDLPSQVEMVQSALSNNPKGLVLATIGEGFTDLLKQAYDKKIPVIEFDSGIWDADKKALNEANKNPIISTVATSNKKASALAAEKFFEEIKSDIEKSENYKIGIIQHDETITGIDRAGGFYDMFKNLADNDDKTSKKYTIYKEIKPGDADNAYKTALEALYEKGVNAIYMTNEGVVKQVYDAISSAGSKYDKIKFFGFDAGTKQIEWMKKQSGARLIGAVAQDSYNIGYKAVLQCIYAIEGKETEKNVGIEGAFWHSENVDSMIKENLVYEG